MFENTDHTAKTRPIMSKVNTINYQTAVGLWSQLLITWFISKYFGHPLEAFFSRNTSKKDGMPNTPHSTRISNTLPKPARQL